MQNANWDNEQNSEDFLQVVCQFQGKFLSKEGREMETVSQM